MCVLSDDEPSSGSSEEEHRMLCLCHVYVGPRFQGHLTDIEFGALDILCGQALGPDLHGLSLHLLDGRCEIHTHITSVVDPRGVPCLLFGIWPYRVHPQSVCSFMGYSAQAEHSRET